MITRAVSIMPGHDEALFQQLIVALYVVCAAFSSAHALLTKPDPRSAMGWIATAWLLPFAGTLIYLLFGVNRVRTRARQLRAGVTFTGGGIFSPLPEDFASQLTRIGDAVTQRPRLPGNEIIALENGENAFPLMLQAIDSARHSVWLSTYIFETDPVGRKFIAALAAAAARGAQVHALVDGIGEWYSWPHAVRLLRHAGVRAARFLPPRFAMPMLSLNLRNHRKLLIVDGETGFVGGMNIGGREVGKAHHRRMADLHFRVRGPAVSQLADCFAADWQFAAGEALIPPPIARPDAGSCVCRVITEGPDEDADKLLFVILGAISVAHRQVLIMTPYFIPPPELTAALQTAALRGVEVCLVLPARSNLRYVDWATRRWLPPLLERGVQVYLQPPPFSHTKLIVVDGSYAQIGSANIDPRSLRLNFEIAMEVYDQTACAQLAKYVLSARDHANRFPPQPPPRLPLAGRLRDSLFWLLSPYL
ncbi:MAG TPA: phospholipase D-like domain-containing protein [Steroidobacteraceae bacterium]|nr:phospholipase D-like domain-containing protein [Steroidobacteraceae bacterium]